VAALKKVKDGEDKDAIQKAVDELNETVQKVGAEMYKAAQETKEKTGEGSTQGNGEPQQAEYEEVQDEKKKEGDTATDGKK